MNRKLIADAGSTKIEWMAIDIDNNLSHCFKTVGINALLADDEEIISILNQVRIEVGQNTNFSEIHFYGAGCASETINKRMSYLISQVIKSNDIFVMSDLMAAARALFNDKKGIACILGTGSNSCLYDGREITANVPSLGFILGDEGGGVSIGKKFISDIYKGLAPGDITTFFMNEYNYSIGDILEKVYKFPAPNRFLASFMPFIYKHKENGYIKELIINELYLFMTRNILAYPSVRSIEIGFVGSVAVIFEDILRVVGERLDLKIGKIIKKPMDGLVTYHKTKDNRKPIFPL